MQFSTKKNGGRVLQQLARSYATHQTRVAVATSRVTPPITRTGFCQPGLSGRTSRSHAATTSLFDSELDPCTPLSGRGSIFHQHCPVELLYEEAAVPDLAQAVRYIHELAGGGFWIRVGSPLDEFVHVDGSSLAPRATIFSTPSGKGRCSAFASSHGARSQASYSSADVRITGIAFGWIGATTAFGAVVR